MISQYDGTDLELHANKKAFQPIINETILMTLKMPDLKIKIKLSASILIAHVPVQITYLFIIYIEREKEVEELCAQKQTRKN